MVTPEWTQYTGFRRQEKVGGEPVLADPIDGNDDFATYHAFGRHPISWGDFARLDPQYMQTYFGNNVEPFANKLKTSAPLAVYSYQPVNTMMFPYIMGLNNYTYASGKHTFTARDVNEQLPVMYNRFEKGASTLQTLTEAKVSQLTFGLNLEQKGAIMTESVVIMGRQISAATHQSSLAPSYPNSLSDTYQWKKSTPVFKWDNGGDNVDYSSVGELLQFSFAFATTSYPVHTDDGNDYPEEIREGPINMYTCSFDIVRTSETSIWDDMISLDLDNDIQMKIFNDASNSYYRQVDLTDLMLTITANHAIQKNGDNLPVWRVQGVGKSLTLTSEDGLNQSYYDNTGGTNA